MIDKTTAAKYEVTWGMQPHLVSSGAQKKNFAAFADLVARRWESVPDSFNELYWKNLVAKGLMFEAARRAIAKADWYQKGYLANYVTYTVAKLAYEVGRQAGGRTLDLEAIWSHQAVPQAVVIECLEIGIKVQTILTAAGRPVQNVTEWAKRPECWTAVQAVEHTLSQQVLTQLGDTQVAVQRRRDATAAQKIDTGIEAQMKVVALQPLEWVAVQEFLRGNGLLSPTDLEILDTVTGRRPGLPSEAQSKRLLGMYKRAADNGFR